MSDFEFQVKADPSDADKAISGLEDHLDRLKAKGDGVFRDDNGRLRDAEGRFLATGVAAQGAGNAMEAAAANANHLFEALEAYAGLHVFESLLDGYTEVGNRIRSVATDQANFNGLMQETYDIAQATRTGWDDTAATYQRLQNATKGLGLSQRDVLELQTELAKATKLSGSSAQESAMTMRELAHAFETGSLTMREWKVIQRDAPALVNELKEASGKTGAQLAKMAHDGQLSAQELIKWFAAARDDIDSKFGKLIPTIADDLLMLKNAAEKFFGEAGAGAGIMQALGNATKFLIDHLDTIGKVALGVIEVLAGLFIISKIISLVQALSAAIAANPLGALLLAITIGISLLRQFGDQIETNDVVMSNAGKTAVTVGDYLRALWEMVKQLGDTIYTFLKEAWAALTSAFSKGVDGSGIEFSLRNVLVFIASFIDVGIGLFKAFKEDTLKLLGGIVASLGEMILDAIHKVLEGIEFIINKMVDLVEGLLKKVADLSQTKVGAFFGLGNLGAIMKQMGGSDALTGALGRVDLSSWKNPLDGAWKATKEIAGNFAEIVTSENSAKKLADEFADKWKNMAEAQARARKPADASTISGDRGDADPVGPTDKQLKELEKLQNELRALLESTNPQIKANEELSHGFKILSDAVANGSPVLLQTIAQYGGVTTIMDRFKEKLQDQIDPMGAVLRQIGAHTKALRDDADAQTLAMNIEKEVAAVRQKQGGTISDVQVSQLSKALAIQQEREKLMKAEQADTAAILGPQKTWMIQQEALNELLDKGKISASQYITEIDKQRQAYLTASGEARTFAGGLESAWLQIKSDVGDVGGSIKKTLVDAFASVNNAIVQLVTTGKADWHAMVNSMLADLTQLMLKQMELNAIKAVGAAFGIPIPGNQYGGSFSVPAFATGGSMTVGGAGGTDSKLVAFRATPGERVTVQTPEQQRKGDAQRPGGAFHAHMIVVANQEEAAIQAMSTPRGRQVSIQSIQQNSRAVQRLVR